MEEEEGFSYWESRVSTPILRGTWDASVRGLERNQSLVALDSCGLQDRSLSFLLQLCGPEISSFSGFDVLAFFLVSSSGMDGNSIF